MNAGLVITFVVGGIFLISILSFNRQVMTNTQEVTLNTINQARLDDLVAVLDNDFNRIGFNVTSDDVFEAATSTKVEFWGDILDGDAHDETKVTWEWKTSSAVSSSSNPNDYYLSRTGPLGGADSRVETLYPVVYFELNFYRADDSSPGTDLTAIKKIEVEIMLETAEPYSINDDNDVYPRLVWERIYVPNNINKPY